MTALVSQSEGALLSVARCAVGLVPPAEVGRLLGTSVPPPRKLGPTCRRLLQETLAKGTVLALARQGGWYGGPGGRLWDRGPLPALEFSPAVVELLQWVLSTPLAERDVTPLRTSTPLSTADAVVVVVLMDRLRGTGWEGALAAQAPLRASPLVVLAHAAELGLAAPLGEVPPLDPATMGFAVEGLRALLARAWVAPERTKRELLDPGLLRRLAQAQAGTLEGFLGAVDAAGQRHLASFLVDAAVEQQRLPHGLQEAGKALDPQASMRDRSEARRACAAVARCWLRLEAWDQEHRAVRFFDDGYAAAQALVEDWSRLGPSGFAASAAAAAALEGLPS